MTEIIKFYLRENPYGFLSNFWRERQTDRTPYGNQTYQTNEHFYQSHKPINEDISNWIAAAPTAYAAMTAGDR